MHFHYGPGGRKLVVEMDLNRRQQARERFVHLFDALCQKPVQTFARLIDCATGQYLRQGVQLLRKFILPRFIERFASPGYDSEHIDDLAGHRSSLWRHPE
jgi:hypothetical protein